MTLEEMLAILAHQKSDEEFAATEIGKLLIAYEKAYAEALRVDRLNTVSDQLMKDVWARSDSARVAFVNRLKALAVRQ